MANPDSFGDDVMNNDLLQVDKDEIFRLLDISLSVAASKWPQDFRQRRAQMVEKFFTAPLIDGSSDQESNSIVESPESESVRNARSGPGVVDEGLKIMPGPGCPAGDATSNRNRAEEAQMIGSSRENIPSNNADQQQRKDYKIYKP